MKQWLNSRKNRIPKHLYGMSEMETNGIGKIPFTRLRKVEYWYEPTWESCDR
jgi:hypothetical protein